MVRLRNTTSSSTNATIMINPMASGALPVSTAVRSVFCAAGPPTRAAGTAVARLERRRRTRLEVAGLSTAVRGVTRMATRPVAAGGAATWAATTPRSALASAITLVEVPAGVVMKIGAAAPGPKALVTRS